jgi:hypothetical protein
MSNVPKGAVSALHMIAGVAASRRWAGPFATEAELKALTDGRVDRMGALVVTTAGDLSIWGWIANSEAAASASVLLPDDEPAAGRWHLMNILAGELADGSVTTAKLGALAVTDAKIAAATITAAKLAGGAGVAALLAAGLGASAAYTKTTNGVQTLLASDAAARVVLIMAQVTEAFADAGGTQTTFTIGEADTATKYAAAAIFTGATLGAVKFFAGTLTATKALIVTANDAAGAGTGGISVTALVLPAAA